MRTPTFVIPLVSLSSFRSTMKWTSDYDLFFYLIEFPCIHDHCIFVIHWASYVIVCAIYVWCVICILCVFYTLYWLYVYLCSPQHLSGLHVIKDLSHGTLDGDKVGSSTVSLRPAILEGGDFDADTKTAGYFVHLAFTFFWIYESNVTHASLVR